MLAAGTAAPTHNACAVIWRFNFEAQEVELLVIDVRSTHPETSVTGPKMTKFPGGGNRIPGEPVWLTVKRETLEETYLTVMIDDPKEIWSHTPARDPNHTKFGFLIPYEECRGELRTKTVQDHNDEIEPPRFELVSCLKTRICDQHQPLFVAACLEIGI